MFKDFLNSKLTGAVLNEATGLKAMPKSQAKCVAFGYGQVEPNHLSAQRNGQIYAQLPANPEINILEQGQFVKYDYAANDNGIGEVNFKGKGEWMLVYNEIKLYRNHLDGTKQWDCEFAMIKDDYQARVYSPYDYEVPEQEYQTKFLNGKDQDGNTEITVERLVELNRDGKTVTINDQMIKVEDLKFTYNDVEYTLTQRMTDDGRKLGVPAVVVPVVYAYDDFTRNTEDPYEFNFTNDPYKKLGIYQEKMMRPGTSMVPRVFKTMIGDHYTTNMIDEEFDSLTIGTELSPRAADGILCKDGDGSMTWQVVKLYTMPDGQPGVKVMRIA